MVGFLLKKWLKETFFHPLPIAIVAIVFALLMLAAEWWGAPARAMRPPREESQITWLDACGWASGRRAGRCRAGRGRAPPLPADCSPGWVLRRARFSFLLSLPVILGAGAKELYDEYKKLSVPKPDEPASLFASGDQVAALVVGTLVSAVVGYFAIAFLLSFLEALQHDGVRRVPNPFSWLGILALCRVGHSFQKAE